MIKRVVTLKVIWIKEVGVELLVILEYRLANRNSRGGVQCGK